MQTLSLSEFWTGFIPGHSDILEQRLSMVANVPVIQYTMDGQQRILRPGQVLPFSMAHRLFTGAFSLEYHRYQLLVPLDKDDTRKLQDFSPSSRKVISLQTVITPDAVIGHLGSGITKSPGMNSEDYGLWLQALDRSDFVVGNEQAYRLWPTFYQVVTTDHDDNEFVQDMFPYRGERRVLTVQRVDGPVWFLDRFLAPRCWPEACEILHRQMEFTTMDQALFIGVPVAAAFKDPSHLTKDIQTLANYRAEQGIKPICLPFPMRDQKDDVKKKMPDAGNKKHDAGSETMALASVLNAPAFSQVNKWLAKGKYPLIQPSE